MFVIKRDGRREAVKFDKITSRLFKLSYGLDPSVDIVKVAQKTIEGIYDGITTAKLDSLAAEVAASLSTKHPDYATLAARVAISNLHKNTKKSFSETVEDLYRYVNPKTNSWSPMIADDVYQIVKEKAPELDSAIIHDRDFSYDYFGFKTLEKSYLLRIDGHVVERPQHLLMRVALGIHKADIESAIETYELMSTKLYTHATPTLFNSGTPRAQMSSCFLVTMKDDSIEGIYETLKITAKVSQYAGGLGISVHPIRGTGSYIRGTNGTSNGLVPMLKVFNDTARYVDQGGGKRKGAFAVYIEPWHSDIFEFLDLKKNHGKEEMRARDMFYALWIPDLFMKRVEADGQWTLMCPNECKDLYNTHGEKFEDLYEKYEAEGKGKRTIKARELWEKIVESQIETGTPYMLYKDAANNKSNQQNLGTIRSSNLCTEIIEYSSPDEVAVCNLASISLPMFVENGELDHKKLFEVTYKATKNLNRVIDVNFYPIEEAARSNLRHRPIGLGVQGLADAFIKLRLPFTSPAARKLNREIFETIYFAALSASKDLAIAEGTYETYPGSPISQGIFQFEMWGVKENELSGRWNWSELRAQIIKSGVRNSLLLAPMPTASTSQILGNNECFEPYTSNLYVRRVLSGEFVIVNKHLVDDLMHLGLWDDEMRQEIMRQNGSIQSIETIPAHIRELYKTVWEMSMRDIIDMAAERAIFIDQSQSLNLFVESPNLAKLTSMHFYAWKKGLKTGMYYLRTKSASDAIKFTVGKKVAAPEKETSPIVEIKNPPQDPILNTENVPDTEPTKVQMPVYQKPVIMPVVAPPSPPPQPSTPVVPFVIPTTISSNRPKPNYEEIPLAGRADLHPTEISQSSLGLTPPASSTETIPPTTPKLVADYTPEEQIACSLDNPDECLACSA